MVSSIILAAGEGTRMRSRVPKVLHTLCGRSMVGHVLEALKPLSQLNVMVVGHQAEEVKGAVGGGYFMLIRQSSWARPTR